ncbi:hypothetical protein D9756_000752 [Leucocoprinus leucothites]|uniref:Uncharacterized protein n=1 Tax=Leucocoprinus leucothites TaxID=201217 RepID=A0A8H5GFY2_9AGAR|nr:hypothetical protein D9756_000752 [Leucoagaricus leucothites]
MLACRGGHLLSFRTRRLILVLSAFFNSFLMNTQRPPEFLHHHASNMPSSSIPTPQTLFSTPEFRSQVVQILSRTANGCLQELNYRPGMIRELADQQALVAQFQTENKKLFEDNQQLALMVKNVRAKQKSLEQMHHNRVQSLEQQIAALQRDNQAILAREKQLAVGHPEYARLQNENIHLRNECVLFQNACMQLRQHIAELQAYAPLALAPNQILTQSLDQQNRVVSGGQPVQARIPHSVQDALREQQQQQLARGQNASSPTNVSNPQSQTQRAGFHPSRPSIIIPDVPGTSVQAQGSQRGNPNGGFPTPSVPQINHAMAQYKTPVSAAPRPSTNSSKASGDTIEFNSQGFRVPVSNPQIQGWANGTSSASPHPAVTVPNQPANLPPRVMNPPRRQTSAPSAFPGPKSQLQPPQHPQAGQQHMRPPQSQSQNRPQMQTQSGHPNSAPSPTTTSPTVPSLIPNGRLYNPMINASAGVPIVNPPQGMPTFPVGPPGKFLPSLVAYTKVPSPSTSGSGSRSGPTSRPVSQQGSPARKTSGNPSQFFDLTTPSPFVDLAMSSPVETQSPVGISSDTSNPSVSTSTIRSGNGERSHTPHLTPSSSRGSAGPSEGVSEAVTPLDVSLGDIVAVAGSPTTGNRVIVGDSNAEPATITPSLLKKRGSVHMDTDDEAEVPLADLMRKKPRLDRAPDDPPPPNGQSNVMASTPNLASVSASTSVMAGAPAPALGAFNTLGAPAVSGTTDDDDDDDDDDDEEIGPDGTRSIKSCLNIFTEEEDDGTFTCSLCLSRHQQGLIAEPMVFAAGATQEEKVHHFVDEHPTSWENLLRGTVGHGSG